MLRLGAALGWRYWLARSREQEALGLLVPVLRRPDAGDDPALFAAALTAAAAVACYIDVSMARQFAEQGVQVARQLGDERELSRALVILCDAYFFAGAPEAACPFGQEAVERARRLGDDVLLAEGLTAYLLTVDPARSGICGPRRSPAPNDLATISSTACCTTTPGSSHLKPGTCPPPGLTWKPPPEPGSRSDFRRPS